MASKDHNNIATGCNLQAYLHQDTSGAPGDQVGVWAELRKVQGSFLNQNVPLISRVSRTRIAAFLISVCEV